MEKKLFPNWNKRSIYSTERANTVSALTQASFFGGLAAQEHSTSLCLSWAGEVQLFSPYSMATFGLPREV